MKLGIRATIIASIMGIGLVAGIIMAAIAFTGNSSSEDSAWKQGQQYGKWWLAFDGYGSVSGTDDDILMYPQIASREDITHACLVYTDETFENSVDFEITLNTEQQLRDGEPNTWEVGWVLWNYTDPDHFYALVLKPNGWELSKQDPAYPGAQRFLASGHEPVFPINQNHRVRIIQVGNTVTFYANGEELGKFTDEERPYQNGSIALYLEDARVRFTDLVVNRS